LSAVVGLSLEWKVTVWIEKVKATLLHPSRMKRDQGHLRNLSLRLVWKGAPTAMRYFLGTQEENALEVLH
jgi:hypothetical protein